LGRAGDAAAEVLLDNEVRALHRYQACGTPSRTSGGTRPARRRRSLCTAAELKEINEQVFQLTTRYFARMNNPEERPAGARLVRFRRLGRARATPIDPEGDPDA